MLANSTRLRLVYLSRFGVGIAMMCYAGALPFLVKAWNMTFVEAGSVQSAYNIAYAVSLLLTSWLADRVGARRIFAICSVGAAIAFLAFVVGARSYHSALWSYGLVAIFIGGTYGTSLILVSELSSAPQRGKAVGWNLAASSLGYLAGIFLVVSVSSSYSYKWGLVVCAIGPFGAALAGLFAVCNMPTPKEHEGHVASGQNGPPESMWNRTAILLTLGYTAHCWELLGMWAWTPAFLATALGAGSRGVPALAFWIAASLHLGGALSTSIMGPASDRWGRRRALIIVAALGAILSTVYGWLMSQSAPVLLLVTFAYSFAVLGDSGVLSTAMMESVPKRRLGAALAFRSVFGFGAGAISPLVFGWILGGNGTSVGQDARWGWAFLSLGIGGIIATASAIALRISERPCNRAPERSLAQVVD